MPTVTSVKPLVYGYVRLEWPNEAEIDLMRNDITTYCTLNGYHLGAIFVDRGVTDDVFARTGFIDLLQQVRRAHAHGVVVTSIDHLSSEAFVQDALKRMVEQAKAEILVVYEANGGGGPPVEGG